MGRKRKGILSGITDAKEQFDQACDESSNKKTSNLDGLPDFRETFELQIENKYKTFWFCDYLDHNLIKATNKLKQGRGLTPFYYTLSQFSAHLAKDVARCVLLWLDERPRLLRYFEWLLAILKYFTDVLIQNNVRKANSISIEHLKSLFQNISTNYVKKTLVKQHKIFVEVIQHLPQLKSDVKFFLTEQSSISIPENKKQLTVELIEKKLNGDHSNKTMFQIAGYTHYFLNKILSTIECTKRYIASEHYVDVFEIDERHRGNTKNCTRFIGRRVFFNALKNGTDGFEQAMQMELAASYKFILAYEFVRDNSSNTEYTEFCKHPESAILPNIVSGNINVLYVIRVLKQLLYKSIKKDFISTLRHGNFSVKYPMIGSNDSLNKVNRELTDKYFFYTAQFGWNTYTEMTSCSKLSNPIPILLGRTSHYDFLVVTYLLMNTGCNLEVFTNMPARVKGYSILENYSKETGSGEDVPFREREVSLFGYKKRNAKNGPAKKIFFDVPVHSPAYLYLSALNDIRPADRKLFFQFEKLGWNTKSKVFVKKFNITDEKNDQLKSLQSRKFRKTFLGHMMLERLKNINSADELIAELRKDMDHDDFSTTMGYLMQSGHSSLVINTTIIALQMKLIDDALTFSGQINLGIRNKKEERNDRFLCDCQDPSNPPHDIKLEHCRRFHLCLGCSRSEVFKEHLPAIIYHIFDIEERKVTQPEVYKIAFEDKHMQAKDVISRFRLYTDGGEEEVVKAYQIATTAKANNIILCPPILNA